MNELRSDMKDRRAGRSHLASKLCSNVIADNDELQHVDLLHRYNILSQRITLLQHLRAVDHSDRRMDSNVSSQVCNDLSKYSMSYKIR